MYTAYSPVNLLPLLGLLQLCRQIKNLFPHIIALELVLAALLFQTPYFRLEALNMSFIYLFLSRLSLLIQNFDFFALVFSFFEVIADFKYCVGEIPSAEHHKAQGSQSQLLAETFLYIH